MFPCCPAPVGLQCREVQGMLPSAGKIRKSTCYGSHGPPEAPGLGLSSGSWKTHPGARTRRTHSVPCLRPHRRVATGFVSENSKLSKARVFLDKNNSKLLHRVHCVPDTALNDLLLLMHLGDYFRSFLSVGLIIELGWIITMQNLIKPDFKGRSDMKTLRETLRSFIPQIFIECLFWARCCSRTWE